MMVPRAYSAASLGSSPPRGYDEKQYSRQQARAKEIPRRKKDSQVPASPPRTRSPSSLDSQASSSAHRTPSYRPRLQPSRPESTTGVPQNITRPETYKQPLRRQQSAQEVLAATAIPIRRKPRQRPHQRVPHYHASEFSRLLQGDVKPGKNGTLSTSLSNPIFDSLFGHIDELVEGEMFVGSEELDTGILNTRSVSTSSIASLASPEDFSSVDNASLPASISRVQSSPKVRQLPHSESCEHEHPLMQFEKEEESFAQLSIPPPGRRNNPQPSKPNVFKSSLTASLKAIKSAAQSVTNHTTSTSIQPDEFLSHSVFDIQPSVTDDRRPPPYEGIPSPALRRYLNPDYSRHPDSPTQLHFWLDDRSPPTSSSSSQSKSGNLNASFKSKVKKKYTKDSNGKSASRAKLPPTVPLATCIPSTVRTAHASSPPIWLTPDGTPSNKCIAGQLTGLSDEAFAAFGGPKQREPRENRDFLRVFVCEMEMRRHGKLAEGVEGRARMWLPPVDYKVDGQCKDGAKLGRKGPREMAKWTSWNADEF